MIYGCSDIIIAAAVWDVENIHQDLVLRRKYLINLALKEIFFLKKVVAKMYIYIKENLASPQFYITTLRT